MWASPNHLKTAKVFQKLPEERRWKWAVCKHIFDAWLIGVIFVIVSNIVVVIWVESGRQIGRGLLNVQPIRHCANFKLQWPARNLSATNSWYLLIARFYDNFCWQYSWWWCQQQLKSCWCRKQLCSRWWGSKLPNVRNNSGSDHATSLFNVESICCEVFVDEFT